MMNSILITVADRVAKQELQTARALGFDALDCFLSSYRCFDDVMDIANSNPVAPVTTFRPMVKSI